MKRYLIILLILLLPISVWAGPQIWPLVGVGGFTPASPGPIGGTTPAAGTFTTLSLPNSGILSGKNFSGATTVSLIDLYSNDVFYIGDNAGFSDTTFRTGTGVFNWTIGGNPAGTLSLTNFTIPGTFSSSGGSANLAVCWKSDGKTLGYGTVAEVTAGTCH